MLEQHDRKPLLEGLVQFSDLGRAPVNNTKREIPFDRTIVSWHNQLVDALRALAMLHMAHLGELETDLSEVHLMEVTFALLKGVSV